MSIAVTLPDGSIKEYPAQTTLMQIAESISPGLKKNAVAGRVDGRLVDLSWEIREDALVSVITLDSEDGLHIYRHSTAHLMAQAVKRIYGHKSVHLGVGPVIDYGYYYDMDLEHSITVDNLIAIEQEMQKIVQEDLPIIRREVNRKEAEQIFHDDPYKLELIHDLPMNEVITVYQQGEFVDLCRGPHLPSTGKIKAFKLMSVAGAYWRGNSDNKMLQMNCPGHMLVYKNTLHSYRELPIRISEFGQVHRHEFSGALNGMMRVRTFCQDDAHIFVRPDQIEEEIKQVIEFIGQIYEVFGFEYSIELSTRPEDSMGSEELWERAELSLKQVLDQQQLAYRINEGDGAFYGPKIDFHILDSLKRSWQCGTIQLDFQFPEKFDLSYIGEDNLKHRPVVIHRAVYGSIERFIGILTEHYGGAFPLWLAPVQVKIIPVSDHYLDYSLKVKKRLEQEGIRVDVDVRNEKLGYKIREAGLLKTPYIFVLGEKEVHSNLVAIRKRGEGDLGTNTLNNVIDMLKLQIDSKE